MKHRIFLILVLAFFVVCPQVFAASVDNEATPGSVLAVEGGVLNFSFSPKVAGMYNTEATGGNEQWYAIVTYHPGGQQFYATTSDSSSIYKQSRETVETFANVTVPESPVANLVSAAVPETSVGADDAVAAVYANADTFFIGNGWTK